MVLSRKSLTTSYLPLIYFRQYYLSKMLFLVSFKQFTLLKIAKRTINISKIMGIHKMLVLLAILSPACAESFFKFEKIFYNEINLKITFFEFFLGSLGKIIIIYSELQYLDKCFSRKDFIQFKASWRYPV